MTLLPPRGERALPVLAGVLLALAFPPAAFLLPPFVALVPLLVFVAERPVGPAGRWVATRGALLTGVVFYGLRLVWLAIALLDRSPLAVPAYLLTVLVLTGLLGAAGWTLHLVRERLPVPLPVVAALAWGALEWVHAHLGPFAFPWLALGTSLAPFPRLAGAADLVGASGLGVWLAAVNGAIAALVLRARAGRPVGATAVAATALLVLAPLAYGLVRAATLELRPGPRVAVVQPNIGVELKRDSSVALDTSLAVLTRLTAGLGRGGAPGPEEAGRVDLVVWPEVALPAALTTGGLADTVAALSRRAGAPVLVGAYGLDPGDGAGRDTVAFNSAFLVNGGGPAGARYDKRALVPFIERVPFMDAGRLERRIGDLRYLGGLGRGREGAVVDAGAGSGGGGARLGVLICYESAFADLARAYRRAGAEILVNITNDGWYGRDAWWGRTTALWQHPAHMVLRAIETRMGVARAANTGFSLFVDPVGRVHGRTALFEPAVRVATVRTTGELTLFVRWGDWLAALATLAALAAVGAALLAGGPPGRRESSGEPL